MYKPPKSRLELLTLRKQFEYRLLELYHEYALTLEEMLDIANDAQIGIEEKATQT